MRIGGEGRNPQNPKLSDEQIRELLLKAWQKQQGKEKPSPCCGGMGLVVGCPVCKKRWGKKR